MVAFRKLAVERLEQRLVLSASFHGLGDLPGGIFSSSANDVSDDGMTVVGRSFSSGGGPFSGLEAFRWTPAGGMIGLGFLPSDDFSEATGVSEDGSVIAGYSHEVATSTFDRQMVRWESGTATGSGTLTGTDSSRATAISADGSTVVGDAFINGVGNAALVWNSAGVVRLSYLPGDIRNQTRDVSADGSVVVGLSESASARIEAVRWDSGVISGLGDLPGGVVRSIANGVSADGSVVVGLSTSSLGQEAFRWDAVSGMVALGDLPGLTVNSGAFDVSADGSIVVGQGSSAAGAEAFIWDSINGMRSLMTVLSDAGLNLTGWTLSRATAISANGRYVAGTGINPNGDEEAWLATLPGSLTVVDDVVATDENTLLTVSAALGLLANDSGGGTLSVTEVNGQAAKVGAQITLASGALLTVNADGSFTVDPAGQSEYLQVGSTVIDSFTYTMTDGSASDTATVTITITGVNDAPVAVDDESETNADAAVSVPTAGVLANDTDVDDADSKTVSAVNGVAADVGSQVTLASGALVALNADGSFTYDPNGAFDSVPLGETALDSFAYTIVDSQGATASATVNMTVHGVEVAPISVVIDVKPGSDVNLINVGINGVIPIAVFTTDTFDAANIDVSTVVFADAHAFSSLLRDVDGDGDQDVLLFFRTGDTNLDDVYREMLVDDIMADGDLDSLVQEVEVELTGETADGQQFAGTDLVRLWSLRIALEVLFGS
jgi:VCBS repeat-containing protein/probable HAF family extracellular repeat protein